MYRITKTYGAEQGFSTCFRQPEAHDSHCGLIHGYALGFSYTVAAKTLDRRNWVFDFAQFKPVKRWLSENFDHTTVIAESDPMLDLFIQLNGFDPRLHPKQLPALADPERGKVIDLRIVQQVGCEGFATLAFHEAQLWLQTLTRQGDITNGAYLESVTVSEHGANSAIKSLR